MSRNLTAASTGETIPFPAKWPDPVPLPDALPPVRPFSLAMLPSPFQSWVGDIAERMQAPADYLGVTAMVAAGSVIGRRVGIRPQRNNNWHEVANLWGCVVGRPGVMKSPAMKQALAPLYRLEARARDDHQAAVRDYKAGAVARELQASAVRDAMKERLKLDPRADLADLSMTPEDEPKAVRFIANDAGYQALAELLRVSAPNGILAYRDELMSLLRALDDESRVEDRGFYLTAWNGSDPYTSDRIGRGFNLHIPAVTISLLGSTQPGKIGEYVRRVIGGGASDDGLIQRIGLMVWPDLAPGWREVDRAPCSIAREDAFAAFDRLAALNAEAAGAHLDEFDPERPFLRFDEEAQDEFRLWWTALEHRLRSGELHSAMESHLSKYRGLIPALALIHHLAGGGSGPVPLPSLLAACAWGEYLESHAARVYGVAIDDSAEGARLILKRIEGGKLDSPFSVRELHQKGWAGLSDREAVARACDRLESHGHIRLCEEATGGRPSLIARVNPAVKGCRHGAADTGLHGGVAC